MGAPYFIRVQDQTPTKFWINNVTPEEAQLAIDNGAIGCTQNPSYTWKMLNHPKQKYHALELLDEILKSEPDDDMAESKLQAALVQEVAAVFLPIYEQSKGKNGYVTIQENPFREEKNFIVERGYANRGEYGNIMIKIPATVDGIAAIETLVRNGIPFNATEVMSIDQAIDVCKLYHNACLESENTPVAVFSHIAGIFDEQVKATAEKLNTDIAEDYLWQAGITVAKKIYQVVKTHWPELGFVSGGARGLHHFTEMIGADAMVTINWKGTADRLIEENPPIVQRFLQPTAYEVIDELTAKCEEFRKAYYIGSLTPEEYESFGPVVRFRTQFEEAWINAREFIKQRRAELGL